MFTPACLSPHPISVESIIVCRVALSNKFCHSKCTVLRNNKQCVCAKNTKLKVLNDKNTNMYMAHEWLLTFQIVNQLLVTWTTGSPRHAQKSRENLHKEDKIERNLLPGHQHQQLPVKLSARMCSTTVVLWPKCPTHFCNANLNVWIRMQS